MSAAAAGQERTSTLATIGSAGRAPRQDEKLLPKMLTAAENTRRPVFFPGGLWCSSAGGGLRQHPSTTRRHSHGRTSPFPAEETRSGSDAR